MSRRTNVHIYPTPLVNETRILKITKSLADGGVFDKILMVGIRDRGLPEQERVDPRRSTIRLERVLGRESRATFWKAARTAEWWVRVLWFMRSQDPACINCHSLPALPLCVALKLLTGSRLIYDTHECETETLESRGFRRMFSKLTERALIRFADRTCVVNESIADWYREHYDMDRVYVVRNVPYRTTRSGRSNGSSELRRRLGLAPSDIIYLHLGKIARGRNAEMLLEAFPEVGVGRHLVFVGDGPLADQVDAHVARHANIHRLPPVRPEELSTLISDADVGLSLLENNCLNHYLSLGNKVFQYLSAGLALVVSDFPEAAKIIDAYQCGWRIAPTKGALLDLIGPQTREEIEQKKRNAWQARDEYGWELEEPSLMQMYVDLGLSPVA